MLENVDNTYNGKLFKTFPFDLAYLTCCTVILSVDYVHCVNYTGLYFKRMRADGASSSELKSPKKKWYYELFNISAKMSTISLSLVFGFL